MARSRAALFAQERLPPRNEYGHVIHPDMPPQHFEEDWDLALQDFEQVDVLPDAVALNRYLEQEDPDCSWWIPAAPNGSRWRLAWILDSDGGPSALFVRHPDFEDQPMPMTGGKSRF